jgi:hypothetical protein
MEKLTMIRKVLGEKCMSHTQVLERQGANWPTLEKVRLVRSHCDTSG